MLRHVEIGRHAALAVHALPERHRSQVAVQRVAPGVIEAGEALYLAKGLRAQDRALVCTAVDEGANTTGLVAGNDYRRGADRQRLVAAGLRQLDVERQEVPGRTLKNLTLLDLVQFRILEDPVRR